MSRTFTVDRSPGESLAVDFLHVPVKRCRNRCLFCFIDQMPRGLRRSLYVKDEDLWHSFLNGSYVTLASAGRDDLARVVSMGLSPLYVSVHAADRDVRNALLGNSRAPDVMAQLRYLQRGGIRFHTQIVVCPGYNDGAELRRTVRALLALRAGLLSCAVVPVGLTRFRKFPMKGVDAALAQKIVADLAPLGDRDRLVSGRRRLFLADEFFLKAGRPLPHRTYYGDYPQLGNGVGLARRLLEDWRSVRRRLQRGKGGAADGSPMLHGVRGRSKQSSQSAAHRPENPSARRCLLLTGASAFPLIAGIAAEWTALFPAYPLDAASVANRFLGETVTVAGLLSARDVLAAIGRAGGRFEVVFVPRAMFNYRGHTLDGYSLKRIARSARAPVYAVDSMSEIHTLLMGRKR